MIPVIVSYLVPMTVVETAGLAVPSRGVQTQLNERSEGQPPGKGFFPLDDELT